jgi:hypothetical protein
LRQAPLVRADRSLILRAAPILVALLVAGCSANGDFGEVKPSLVHDNVHDWVAADATGSIPSGFELTGDERQLRDLAYPLIEPPYLRHTPDSVAREYGWLRKQYHSGNDVTAYATCLLQWPARSPDARYARLIDDIRDDTTRLSQFFETAARVLDTDRRRREAMAYIAVTSVPERTDAARRMNENAAIVGQVRGSLDRRIASYKFALERLVLMTPSSQAGQAEFALGRLKATLAGYRAGAPYRRTAGGSLGQPPY